MYTLRLFLFAVLGIIYFPMMLFVHFTHGKPDEGGWYPTLWKKKNMFARFLAIILWPLYFSITAFLGATGSWFESLSEPPKK